MSERIRGLVSATLFLGSSACATMPDRRAAIAEYSRSLAITDSLDIGECQTIDSVPVIYEDASGEGIESTPQRGLTLRERFRLLRLSKVETLAAYAHYRFICGLIEGELSRTRIQIPEDSGSEPE